jgi:vanillate O-demethylase ferredoxin subunit
MTAGAHVDVHLPDGKIRQYSLSNDPAERTRYVIAVLKDEAGRGGSKILHETVRVQDMVRVGRPRNNFQLDETASNYILLAGGIGVTPLKAMCHRLETLGRNYKLYYCAKTPAFAAFRDELESLGRSSTVCFHHDGGNPADSLDLKEILAECKAGTQVYYCGPAGFMMACGDACRHWPAGSVHFEHFKAPATGGAANSLMSYDADGGFDVKIASSGQTIRVDADQSIVAALANAGIPVETSCVSGLCGSCKVHYLSGEPDHRDFILNDGEKQEYLTACVSRCRVGPIVLDL